MDSTITLVNFLTCVFMAAVASYGVLSTRVRDGVVVKIGLIFVALGFAGHAWVLYDGLDLTDVVAMARAQLLINAGGVIVGLGWAIRTAGGRHPRRRTSDWAELDDAHHG